MGTNKNSKKKIIKIQNREKEDLERKLLRVRIMEDLSEIKKIKVTIKNKEEIEEFSKNFKKIIELDVREIRYETNKLLRYLRMKKKLKQMK